MDDQVECKLSMLLDDELSPTDAVNLLQHIETDQALKAKWNRYNLMSVAMKAEHRMPIAIDFVDRVGRVLQSEPVVVLPQGRGAGRSWGGIKLAGVLAAGLACVAFFAWQERPQEGVSPVPLAQLVRAEPRLADQPHGGQTTDSSRPDPNLDDYLVTHSELSYVTATQGILPYARVVTYSMEK